MKKPSPLPADADAASQSSNSIVGVSDERLREAAFAFQPRARAAAFGGSLLYGLSSAQSDIDVWVFHALPVRAFLGLKNPPLANSLRETVEGRPLDMRAADIKALAVSWMEGSFYEIEHLFSPLVFFGGDWLAELRKEARRHACRNVYHSVLRRASMELRFSELGSSAVISAKLHALRVLSAGAHYLETGGDVVSNINRLNDMGLNLAYLPEALELVRKSPRRSSRESDHDKRAKEARAKNGGKSPNDAEAKEASASDENTSPPDWLEQLAEDVKKARERLDTAHKRSKLPAAPENIAQLDYYLKRLRLEMDDGDSLSGERERPAGAG